LPLAFIFLLPLAYLLPNEGFVEIVCGSRMCRKLLGRDKTTHFASCKKIDAFRDFLRPGQIIEVQISVIMHFQRTVDHYNLFTCTVKSSQNFFAAADPSPGGITTVKWCGFHFLIRF